MSKRHAIVPVGNNGNSRQGRARLVDALPVESLTHLDGVDCVDLSDICSNKPLTRIASNKTHKQPLRVPMTLLPNVLAQTAQLATSSFSTTSSLIATSTYLSFYTSDSRLDPLTTKLLIIYAIFTGLVGIVIWFFGEARVWRISSGLFLFLGLFAVSIVIYRNVIGVNVLPVFAPKDLISSTWIQYKLNYIEPETGRSLDKERNNITTSEGQSYSMLRSVWVGDREAFDLAWEWTKDHLQHNGDGLFSWLYGTRPNNTLGVLTNIQGQNSASDADTDIALALLFAYSRWQDTKYLEDAKKIIQSIWKNEVIMINGRPYMASDNVEKNSKTTILINPSYLVPYAYRIFANVDPDHDWMGVVDTSYEVIEQSIVSPLDKNVSAYLPPDWIQIDIRTGVISATTNATLRTNFSYDALRIPWRLGLDLAWYKEERARVILKQFEILATEWKTNHVIHSDYAHDGMVVALEESPSMYGGVISALKVIDERIAREVYQQKLVSLFNPDSQSWNIPLGYYNENWVWFGVALYNDLLPNLWDGSYTRR